MGNSDSAEISADVEDDAASNSGPTSKISSTIANENSPSTDRAMIAQSSTSTAPKPKPADDDSNRRDDQAQSNDSTSTSTRKWNSDPRIPVLGDGPGRTELYNSIRVGNECQLRTIGDFWTDKTERCDYSYFITPMAANEMIPYMREYMYESRLQVTAEQFLKFLRVLDEKHLERRFLLDFVCAVDGIDRTEIKVGGSKEQEHVDRIKKLLIRMVGEILWKWRYVFMNDRRSGVASSSVFCSTISGLLTFVINRDYASFALLWNLHDDPYDRFVQSSKELREIEPKESDRHHLTDALAMKISQDLIAASMRGFHDLCIEWTSFVNADKIQNLRRTGQKQINNPSASDRDQAQEVFTKKMNTCLPHWCPKDRAYVLESLEKFDPNCDDYISRLVRQVGRRKFMHLAFGKEKFCSNCRRSSYVATDRLWSCKRCVRENVHPRALYCNAECQRQHWPRHKSQQHSMEICANCGERATNAEMEKQFKACKRCVAENSLTPARYCSNRCLKSDFYNHKARAHPSETFGGDE